MLTIADEQRIELSRWAQSRMLPAGDVFRARVILPLADGQSYCQIMRSLQTTAPTISRSKQRFEQDGIDGLDPRHKGSQPRVADAAVQAASTPTSKRRSPSIPISSSPSTPPAPNSICTPSSGRSVPSWMMNGEPLASVRIPESCHPPNRRPLRLLRVPGDGNSQTPLLVKRCR